MANKTFFVVPRSHIPFGVSLLDSIAGPMVTINSSFNFIIYCILGEAFRKESVKFLDELKKKLYQCSLLSSIKGSCVFGRNKVDGKFVTNPPNQSIEDNYTTFTDYKNLDCLFMNLS